MYSQHSKEFEKLKKQSIIENLQLDKLVHGGQCLARLPDGKKILVWGGLPNEKVAIKITKNKSSYAEGVVTEIHKASNNRIKPKEPDSYLSTSPWQIMDFTYENEQKQLILQETFDREKIDNVKWQEFYSSNVDFGYRNKIEIGFWGNEEGLHLAHFQRGTHGKVIVDENLLAPDNINKAARDVRDELSRIELWAGKLKTVILRSNKRGEVVASLFVKEDIKELKNIKMRTSLKGLVVYYSNPKSPASLPTKKLYSYGDITLSDEIKGKNITYDVLSFFQVNLPVFEQALTDISNNTNSKKHKLVDMYSGVGTIGIALNADVLVESDEFNIKYAQKNAVEAAEVVHASSERALEYITSESVIIVDPPRAGLHKQVIERINQEKPKQIVYLSCNPITQARDVKLLKDSYEINFARGYNFFPRTPHIESLLVLDKK